MTNSLPRIACFHGGGSTAEIFRVQCMALEPSLSTHFNLVFFNAPFICPAGPGVLPAFDAETFAPYRTWFAIKSFKERDSARPDGWSLETDYQGLERVMRLMLEEGDGGEWVGCMGFSQGTRVVGGLLLEQMRLRKLGERGLAGGRIEFKFGVLCMGGAAPMLTGLSDGSEFDLIDIPTLHLHGLTDKNLENGRKQLANYFHPEAATLVEINYHHAMPWHEHDRLKFTTALMYLYMKTQYEQ